MRRLALLLICLVLAGCAGPAGVFSVTPPSLHATGKDPYSIKANLTNNAEQTLAVSSTGFRLVDAEGNALALYGEGMSSMGDIAFPAHSNLGPGETARGWLSFYAVASRPPYVLKYDYAGARTEYALNFE